MNPYQTLETQQLANPKQNTINLTGTPMIQPNPRLNLNANQVNTPAFNANTNPVISPAVNPNINPVISPAVNPNINPVISPAVNPNINPVISPAINPNINTVVNPVINNIVETPKLAVIRQKSYVVQYHLDFKPIFVKSCPNCNEEITTRVEKSTNIKALCTAIWTCYCGFACLQAFRKKPISFQDVKHLCPKCGYNFGSYYVM